MASQQYWTREAIESMKAPFRAQTPKPAHPQPETLDGGCRLLYRLPPMRERGSAEKRNLQKAVPPKTLDQSADFLSTKSKRWR